MGSNFPVPSKGALRLLRQIVYASSFGTAAAVFLEEPRRQICNARKVLENKRKLQAARGYVSTAALAEPGGQEDQLTCWGRHLRQRGRADFQDFPCNDPILPSDVDVEAVRNYVRSSSHSGSRLLLLEPAEKDPHTRRTSGHDADGQSSDSPPLDVSGQNTTHHQGPAIAPRGGFVWEVLRKQRAKEDGREASRRFNWFVERLAMPDTDRHAEHEYLARAVEALRCCVREHAEPPLHVQHAAQTLLAYIRTTDQTAVKNCELEELVGDLWRQRQKIKQQEACAEVILAHLNSGANDRALASLVQYVQNADATLHRSEIFGVIMLDAVHHLLDSLEYHGNVEGLRQVHQLVGPYFPEGDLVDLIKRDLDAGRPELALELLYLRHARDPQAIGPILLDSAVLILDCLRSALSRTEWAPGETKSLFEKVHGWYLQFESKENLLRKDLQLLLDDRKFYEAVDLLTSALQDVEKHCTPETLAIAYELKIWSQEALQSSWAKKISEWMEMRQDVIDPQRYELRKRVKTRLVQSCRKFLQRGCINAASGSLRCLAAWLQTNDSEASALIIEVLDSPHIVEDMDHIHHLHTWAISYGLMDDRYVAAVLRSSRRLSKESPGTAADLFYSLASFEVDEDVESKDQGQQTYTKYPALFRKAAKLGAKLFHAVVRSCFTGSTIPASRIFRWMAVTGISRHSHLCDLIRAHNVHGEDDRIIEIYSTHLTEEYELPSDVRQNISMALAAAGPVEQALQLLENEWGRGLQAEPRAFITLLERVWKSTRSVEQVKEKLFAMLAWMGDAYKTVLYNCIIGICVKARKSEEAQHFLELLGNYSKPNVITYGHCMFDKAIAGDWTNVKTLLQQAKESGVTETLRRTGCGAFFNRVLDVFRQSHNAQETFEFLMEAIDLYHVPPDQKTSDIAVESFMMDQHLQLVPELIGFLNERGYKFQLTEQSFTYVFRRYYHTFQPKHDVLLRLYNSLRTLTTAWVMPGVLDLLRNAVSFASQDANGASHNLAVREETVKRLEQGASDGKLKAQRVQSRMMRAMSSRDTDKAVRIYKDSLVDGLPLSAVHLEIAVEASIRANNGSLDEAFALISDAQAAGIETTKAYTPILHHRIAKGTLSDSDVTASILGFYKALDEQGLRPRHFLAVSAAQKLLMTGRPIAAIGLLSAVATSKWGLQKPLDIAAMSVFVKAYAAITNIEGISWAVNHVLSTQAHVDEKFIVDVSRARGPFRQLGMKASAGDTVRACKAAIEQLTEWVSICRARKEQQRKATLKVGREIVELGRFVKDARDVDEAVDIFMWHGKGSVPRAERPEGGRWVDGGKVREWQGGVDRRNVPVSVRKVELERVLSRRRLSFHQ